MGLDAPAVLVEIGFISHPQEGRRLEEGAYQDKVATAIVNGVRQFLEQIRSRDGRRNERLTAGTP
jgi:N-acetylmuramoyl-L-alanine amidase